MAKRIKRISLILFLTSSLFCYKLQGNNSIEIKEKLSEYVSQNIWLTNENGELIDFFNELKIPSIINFVYYDCPGICNAQLNEIQNIIENSTLKIGVDYQFMTISINPKDSSINSLEKKSSILSSMKKKTASEVGWKFYTGDSLNISLITQCLGYNFIQIKKSFIHKACLIFVNQNAKITRYNIGINLLPQELEITINESFNGNILPKIYKKDEYCFPETAPAFDRLNRVIKPIGILIISVSIVFFLFLLKPKT